MSEKSSYDNVELRVLQSTNVFKIVLLLIVAGRLAICGVQSDKSREMLSDSPIPRSTAQLLSAVVRRIEPKYPLLAELAHIAGEVIIEVTIDEDGSVIGSRPLSGPPILWGPVQAALRLWKFRPTKISNVSRKVVGRLSFEFGTSERPAIDHALESYRKEALAHPNSSQAHYDLARAYRERYEYLDALREYKLSVDVRADFAPAYFEMAEIYYLQRDYDEAILAYQQTIRIEPKSADAYFQLSSCYIELKKYDKAIEVSMTGLRVKPDLDAEYKVYLGVAGLYREMGRDDDAIKAYRHAIDVELRLRKADPERLTTPELHLKELAVLLERRDRTKEAIAAYKEAVSVASTADEAAWAYADLASLYDKHGILRESAEAYQEAIKRKPEWAEPHYALGLVYLRLGKREAALSEQQILERLDLQMANALSRQIQRKTQ